MSAQHRAYRHLVRGVLNSHCARRLLTSTLSSSGMRAGILREGNSEALPTLTCCPPSWQPPTRSHPQGHQEALSSAEDKCDQHHIGLTAIF